MKGGPENTKMSNFEQLGLDKDKIMAFSDGIFTIAITLLVLEIRLPEIPLEEIDAAFLQNLTAISPAIFSFTFSFFIIASYWLSYHRIFHFIEAVDRRLLALNILFLFFIALMPFPTSLFGSYGAQRSVLIFYDVNIAISSVLIFLMWNHASSGHRLITMDLDDAFIRFLAWRTFVPAAAFTLSIAFAPFNLPLAMASWVFVPLSFPLLRWWYGRYGKN